MSRRQIQPTIMPKEELRNAVLAYKNAKDREKLVKKDISELGALLKQELQNRNQSEIIVGDIKVSITITENQDVNELQAIEILRQQLKPHMFSHVVKKKEYIDDDEFEKLVYANKINADILLPAVTPKAPTVTLRLGKVKK